MQRHRRNGVGPTAVDEEANAQAVRELTVVVYCVSWWTFGGCRRCDRLHADLEQRVVHVEWVVCLNQLAEHQLSFEEHDVGDSVVISRGDHPTEYDEPRPDVEHLGEMARECLPLVERRTDDGHTDPRSFEWHHLVHTAAREGVLGRGCTKCRDGRASVDSQRKRSAQCECGVLPWMCTSTFSSTSTTFPASAFFFFPLPFFDAFFPPFLAPFFPPAFFFPMAPEPETETGVESEKGSRPSHHHSAG
jgi:hypothetical protein